MTHCIVVVFFLRCRMPIHQHRWFLVYGLVHVAQNDEENALWIAFRLWTSMTGQSLLFFMGEFVPACGRDERYCKRRTLRGGFHCCAHCVARGAFTIRLHSLIFGNQLSETVNVNTLYWMCRQLFDGFVHLTSSWRISSVHTDDVTCVDKYPILTRVFRVLGSCSHVDLRCLSAPFWLEMALQRLQPVYGVLYCTDCILDWGHPERYKHAQSCLCNLFLLYYIIHGLDVFFMPIFTGNSDFSTVFVLWVRVPPTFGELKLRISITTEHRAKHVTKSGCIYM